MAETPRRRRRKKALSLQWLELALFRSFQIPLRLLPVSAVRGLGAATGRLAFHLARPRTRLALQNLESVLPEIPARERSEIVRRCWKQFCAETLTYLKTIDAPASVMAGVGELVDRSYLQQAIDQKRGMVVYTAHFGAWESAIGLVGEVGFPFTVVARPLDNEFLERLLKKSRKRFDVEMVPKRNAARALMKRLSMGQGVLVLPDQAVHPREGILVPFLGRPAWTTTAPARLALRYGAPLLGAFCYRKGERVLVELSRPILTEGLEESRENVEDLTRRINDEISERVLRSPESWLWMHDRWKNT